MIFVNSWSVYMYDLWYVYTTFTTVTTNTNKIKTQNYRINKERIRWGGAKPVLHGHQIQALVVNGVLLNAGPV